MSKYIIEGNINFYDELYKSLDDEDDSNENNVCQITGLPLVDKSVILECNHKFNYDALYKEICRQKFDFKTYCTKNLNGKNIKKLQESKKDYFIKCPYCREIQFTILPYYQELGLDKKYGINSLDKNCTYQPITICNNNISGLGYYLVNGVLFNKNGPACCKKYDSGSSCVNNYTATLPNTQLSYCFKHYKP